ncbi:9753_t:CDS:1, partial [Ambispora leptoticha]
MSIPRAQQNPSDEEIAQLLNEQTLPGFESETKKPKVCKSIDELEMYILLQECGILNQTYSNKNVNNSQ